jgi:hypothetical protein
MVAWNDFVELDPDSSADPQAELWLYFHEDLLQLVHTGKQLMIDLGWYPDGSPSGAFRAVVVRHFDTPDLMRASWVTPIDSFRSESRQETVAMIEHWLRTL